MKSTKKSKEIIYIDEENIMQACALTPRETKLKVLVANAQKVEKPSRPKGTCYYCHESYGHDSFVIHQGDIWHPRCIEATERYKKFLRGELDIKSQLPPPNYKKKDEALTDNEELLYYIIAEAVRRKKYLTVKELGERAYFGYTTAHKTIKALEWKGYIRYERYNRTYKKFKILK